MQPRDELHSDTINLRQHQTPQFKVSVLQQTPPNPTFQMSIGVYAAGQLDTDQKFPAPLLGFG